MGVKTTILSMCAIALSGCVDEVLTEQRFYDDDLDRDGLSDEEELALGTDPHNADTDGDGHSDGQEVDAGSDATLCWSVPYGWPDCSSTAEGRSEEGWEMGQLTPFFPMTDQFGDTYTSERFHSMIVVADLCAAWCGPCLSSVPHMEDIYQYYKDEGVMVILVLTDDATPYDEFDDPVSHQNWWVDEFGLTFPVTTDFSYEYEGRYYNTVYAELSLSKVFTGSIPFYAIFDREHRLVDSQVGAYPDGHQIRELIEEHL